MSRILVGVDPSPSGAAAMEWALREAVSTGLPLHAVRAWSLGAYAVEAYSSSTRDLGTREAAQAQLDADEQIKLASERVAGSDTVTCTSAVACGPASQMLVEQARDSALVVMGSRGHGALSRAVLGSVSSSVLHHATCPVTIVPEPRATDTAAPRVVVGVDHSPASLAALAVAADQARRRGATLVALHVHAPIDMPRGGAHPPDLALLEASGRHALEVAAQAAGATDVQAEVLVGHPAERLLAAARPQDLLVVGSRGRGGFAGLLLGSTSTSVAQHATCPVVVVHA
jgi:nucleotide-binding universal stress UspA family protein